MHCCRARLQDIVLPTARAMVAEGTPFRGILFAGLMIKNGKVGCGVPHKSLAVTQPRQLAISALGVAVPLGLCCWLVCQCMNQSRCCRRSCHRLCPLQLLHAKLLESLA